MDEPARWQPGCAHRTERHSSDDCLDIAIEIYNEALGETGDRELAFSKALQALSACELHRELDRVYERCGCKSLYGEFYREEGYLYKQRRRLEQLIRVV